MPKAIYVLTSDGKYVEAIGTEAGELVAVDRVHERNELGYVNTINYREPAVVDGASANMMITTGSKTMRIVNINISLGGDGHFITVKDPTVTGGTAASEALSSKLTLFSRNPGTPISIGLVLVHTVTWGGITGALRGNVPIQGGKGVFATGGDIAGGIDSEIPPNTKFLIVVYNESSQTRQVGIQIDFYEE